MKLKCIMSIMIFFISVTTNSSTLPEIAEDGSPVLMKIDGHPVITLKKFNNELNQFLEKNPNFKQTLTFMPEAKLDFFEGMAIQQIIAEYIRRNGIDQIAAYQQELAEAKKKNGDSWYGDAVIDAIQRKYFNKNHPVTISEAEIKKFYDEYKEKIAELRKSQFDEVKESLRDHLKKQKEQEQLDNLLDKYKREYNVEINNAPLKENAQ